MSTSGIASRTLTTVFIVGAATLAWGTLVERNLFTLRERTVPVLPPGAAPIRVLHISDLHMAPWQHRKQEWVRSLVRLQPDLVVNTGDNLGHERGLEGLEYALAPLAGIPGVFVHGSNDYFAPKLKNPLRYLTGPSKVHSAVTRIDVGALENFFTDRLGWTNLNNTAAMVDVHDTRLEFFGVDDPHQRFDRLATLAGEIDRLRENDEFPDDSAQPPGAASVRSSVTIGVSHAPYQRILNSFVTHGASLIFAGHTHGGQVCVPGFGALVTNCDIPRRQVKGLSLWRHGLSAAYLNVSAGLGTSIYAPVRFACPPEATLLTLTSSTV